MDWSGVDYCDVFISCLDSHSDGTHSHPLLRHWCSDAFLQTWWRNKLILISDELRVNTFTAHFHFWVNYSFNASCLVLIQLSIKYLIKMTRNRAADLSHAVNLFQVKCIALYIWQRVFKHTQHSRNAPHILQERCDIRNRWAAEWSSKAVN